ncbi:Sulfatase family protein [Candidatus Rhodobacter oscarellae]|uniref:Sulfatase family protein n=1 Tax=Candidatus Rhodobacter oscarellae TaxID=1675527 RepID=A0A0J9E5G1_9RHOB|nr:sulfatase-like hydrolase/transferase [Candidatus Rhodobacter lobularis]KMW57987.1 Sulfatase family protein [Candidatus Rhodobacter lobularis]
MPERAQNVLFIMADQLRWDYLSCYGHPHLHTPHLDALAADGMRFNRAYVQSPICGPSRMCTYTGRYCRSHGATWNGVPLRVGERAMGDHLREIGVQSVIVGKTHMVPDRAGLDWLGIDPASKVGLRHAECGFDPFDRDDGLHPNTGYNPEPAYNRFLREKGYNSPNPWDEHANSGLDAEGKRRSGWFLKYSDLPADIPEALSETPYMTTRAMEFMAQAQASGAGPWLCHLSFIKPHWPYIVPPPYHDMYGPGDVLPPVRSEAERATDHPVFKGYIDSRICRSFARDDVREKIIPAYMGLVKQIDDQMGRLFSWMKENGLWDDTMIVFTSDHGDYLGDHWMGEKDLFHDQSARIPLIIRDPRAGAQRGAVSDALVESIDLAPTFQGFFGGAPRPHHYEGRDLTALLHGEAPKLRDFAFSEYDYATRPAREAIGNAQEDARLWMVRDARWKLTYAEGFRPMLFDMESDPDELLDLGASDAPAAAAARARLTEALFAWTRRHHNRHTKDPQWFDDVLGKEPPGVLIGYWDEEDLAADGLSFMPAR